MSDKVKITGRWYLTEDRQRVVGEGDSRARWLHWIPGMEVARQEVERLGAVLSPEPSDTTVHSPTQDAITVNVQESDDESDPETEPEVKVRAKSEDKSRKPAASKNAPEPSLVRAWAKAQRIDVPARGRIPADVVDAYLRAQVNDGG